VLECPIQEDTGSVWSDFAKRTQFVLFGCLDSTATTDGSREARALQWWTKANDLALRRAQAVGVELIDKNGGGPGVRMRV
jgi:hypothetical protein